MSNWPPRENVPCPCPDRALWFQRRLKGIAGLTAGGFPRLKLFWGQTMRERDQYPGSPPFDTGDILRHRYSLQEVHAGWVVKDAGGNQMQYPATAEPPECPPGSVVYRAIAERDIGVPRFFIHGWRAHTRLDAAQYEADSVHKEDGIVIRTGPESMGPGQWSDVLHTIVSNPVDNCCTVAKIRHEICFHDYRAPGQEDLDYLAALWKHHLDEPMAFLEGNICPPWLIEQRVKAKHDAIAASKEQAHAITRENIARSLKESRHRLFDMPRSGYSVATGRMMPTGKNVR